MSNAKTYTRTPRSLKYTLHIPALPEYIPVTPHAFPEYNPASPAYTPYTPPISHMYTPLAPLHVKVEVPSSPVYTPRTHICELIGSILDHRPHSLIPIAGIYPMPYAEGAFEGYDNDEQIVTSYVDEDEILKRNKVPTKLESK